MLRNVQSYFNWGKYHIPIHVYYTSANVINNFKLMLTTMFASQWFTIALRLSKRVYDSHGDSPRVTERIVNPWLAKMVDNKLYKMKRQPL